jgi:hypothetical protein
LFGICHLSLVPCRKEPSDASELVTQLLFGEHFAVEETTEKWSRIRLEYDDYDCWVDNKQFLPISQDTFNTLSGEKRYFSSDLVQILQSTQSDPLPLLLGSTLPAFREGTCCVENTTWTYEGPFSETGFPIQRSRLVETALLYLQAPYLWGGRSPFGIDCSGFTQLVFKLNGKKIKRDAYQQAEQGTLLSFVEEAEAGDLAFFDNADGRIVHVGMVRIDNFDHHGIYNTENKVYSHNLRMIRKILP